MQSTRLFKQAYFTSNPSKRGKPIRIQQSTRKKSIQKVQLTHLIRIQQQKSSNTMNESTRSLTNCQNERRGLEKEQQTIPSKTERIQREQKESNLLKQQIRELQWRLMQKQKENNELKEKIEGQKNELEKKIQKSFQTKIMLQYMQQIQSLEYRRLKQTQSQQNDDGQSQGQLSSKSLILANMQQMKELYLQLTQLETFKQKIMESGDHAHLQDLLNEYNELTNQLQASNQNIFIQVINNKIKLSQLLKRVNTHE